MASNSSRSLALASFKASCPDTPDKHCQIHSKTTQTWTGRQGGLETSQMVPEKEAPAEIQADGSREKPLLGHKTLRNRLVHLKWPNVFTKAFHMIWILR